MFDINLLFEFSRHYCIAICAFLVPTNLLLTSRTIWLIGKRQSPNRVQRAVVMAIVPALLLLLHNFTWFVIGVVMVPSYILLTLFFVCLSFNLWAIVYPTSLNQLLRHLQKQVTKVPLLLSYYSLKF